MEVSKGGRGFGSHDSDKQNGKKTKDYLTPQMFYYYFYLCCFKMDYHFHFSTSLALFRSLFYIVMLAGSPPFATSSSS